MFYLYWQHCTPLTRRISGARSRMPRNEERSSSSAPVEGAGTQSGTVPFFHKQKNFGPAQNGPLEEIHPVARLFSLFGERKLADTPTPDSAAPAPTPVTSKPDAGIPYDGQLIAMLKQDHVQLVNQFTSLMPLLRNHDVRNFRSRLQAFKTEFQGHIIKENVKFYVYLEQSLAKDETNLELIRDFRREMNSISRSVVHFCNRYMDDPMSPLTIQKFAQESNEIAEALLRRIEREERDLYPLYMAS